MEKKDKEEIRKRRGDRREKEEKEETERNQREGQALGWKSKGARGRLEKARRNYLS